MHAVPQIARWLRERHDVALGEGELVEMLDAFVARGLMLAERGRYLSLAGMGYEGDEETLRVRRGQVGKPVHKDHRRGASSRSPGRRARHRGTYR